MTKICFPHHRIGDFDSLQDAYTILRKMEHGWRDYTLFDIVKCNTRFRDHFRNHGLYALMAMILHEECLLAQDKEAMGYLCKAAHVWQIAGYDIQCYNINKQVTILGHTFNGLKDIKEHTEMTGCKSWRGFDCWSKGIKEVYDDIHIGKIYDGYPTFDSFDACDNRCYDNYIFRPTPITQADMTKAYHFIPRGSNFCMISENIPERQLPVLYYSGSGNYMLLASPKVETEDKQTII